MTTKDYEIGGITDEPAESYEFDESALAKADKACDALVDGGAYVGTFVRAEGTTSEKTGARGITLAFESPGAGNTEFTLWTKGPNGEKYFGYDQLQGIMFLVNAKSLKSVKGPVTRWEDDNGKRVQVETTGDTFPDLLKKPIGVVFQQELYSKNNGKGTGTRLNLIATFQAETKLTSTEIKARVSKPAKIERLLRGLKPKDTRKAAAVEPAQPSLGVDAGDY